MYSEWSAADESEDGLGGDEKLSNLDDATNFRVSDEVPTEKAVCEGEERTDC